MTSIYTHTRPETKRRQLEADSNGRPADPLRRTTTGPLTIAESTSADRSPISKLVGGLLAFEEFEARVSTRMPHCQNPQGKSNERIQNQWH